MLYSFFSLCLQVFLSGQEIFDHFGDFFAILELLLQPLVVLVQDFRCFFHLLENISFTRQMSSMIHSTRPTVPPVFWLEFCIALRVFEKWGRTDIRVQTEAWTDDMCQKSVSLLAGTVGWPSGSKSSSPHNYQNFTFNSRFLPSSEDFSLSSCPTSLTSVGNLLILSLTSPSEDAALSKS